MNYHNITHDDMLNGEGLRVVLWVAGCNHHCKNCQNPQTWNENDGVKFDNKAIVEIFRELNKPYIQGITFSGGDPLFPKNRKLITRFAQMIKGIYGKTKDIWLYTGYKYEEIENLEIMKYIDVLVEGEFIEELKDINYKWAGSTNQRIINIADIRKEKERKENIIYA